MASDLILFAGAFLAALLSGAAGFGGGLLLLPLLTRAVGVTEAVPLLTVAQLIGNLSRAGLSWRAIRWRPALLFLLAAAPMAAAGAVSFVWLPKHLVVRLLGVAILLFAALRLAGRFKLGSGPGTLLGGGAATGLLSGLVGTAGPLGAAVFLSLELPPLAYVASEAVTAVGMHLVKIVVYGTELRLRAAFWPLALALGVAMVLGTWAGKLVVERAPVRWFRLGVLALLVVVSLQMIVAG